MIKELSKVSFDLAASIIRSYRLIRI